MRGKATLLCLLLRTLRLVSFVSGDARKTRLVVIVNLFNSKDRTRIRSVPQHTRYADRFRSCFFIVFLVTE